MPLQAAGKRYPDCSIANAIRDVDPLYISQMSLSSNSLAMDMSLSTHPHTELDVGSISKPPKMCNYYNSSMHVSKPPAEVDEGIFWNQMWELNGVPAVLASG